MPSWKKVILSGSDAALNTLSVSNSITASVISASQFTGSLFGTSSWAIRAVSSSYLSGSTAIVNNLTVNNNLIWDSTPNTIAGFASSSGNLGSTPIEWYIDNTLSGRPVSLRVGSSDPDSSQPTGSHILKDGRELFTNAKAAEPNEPFIILGFGGKNDITLDTGIDYQHVGIDDYDNFIAGEVYAGSLKIRKTLYGITEADTGQTKLYSDGFVIPPASPGFVLGDGGFYMFESNSMQFNPSGALLSPVASASVKFTIAPDSSSLSISVGKNDLREMLFISRSGNSPRIGVGKSSSGAALDVNGSVIVTGSLGMSGDLTTQQISASSTVRLSGAILELPNLSVGTTGNYNNLLIVDSTGRVRTLPTGSVPYIEVGSGVVPTNQALVMFTGSTGDIANAIGITYSSVLGWSFSNAGTIYDAVIPNLFTSNLLATNVTSSIISASGGITGSDLRITGFPSVSASLASLASGVGTLQQVTDAGNTTTNAISSSFPGVGFFGTASWAINVVNGGGGGGGGSDSAFLNQSTAATTWSFAHNLGTQYPVITVYDTSGQVIIPQEIDGEDTNNLKIYFPTSQSGYATAVGGTSALTYYSQSLTTASVNLNTITFTKGDSSEFIITVNTGSGGGASDFPYTGSAIISGSLIITGSTNSSGGFTGSLLGTASYALNTPPDAPQPILLVYTSSTSLVDTPSSGYILEIDSIPDTIRLNTQSFNGINLAPVGFGDFYFNQPGSLLTVRATGSGAFKTYKILSYTNSSNYAEYVVQLPNIISSGTLNNGDIVEFRWDKSADVGNLSEASVIDISGTYNVGAVDLFFNNSSFIFPGLSEISTLSYTGSGYIGASITRSANLTIRSLNATTAITSSIISASGGITGSLFGTASWAVSASWAPGGGGSVTINNNVDNYLVTATGTANTLDGEVGLQYSSSILINNGKSRFGGGAVGNTTHQFRATGSDTYAGFLISDPDGEDTFRMVGSMANSDLLISIGDVNDAYGTTKITVDDPNSKINLKGKIYGTAYATNATTLGTNGTYDIGSRLATSWAVAGGPTLTAGRIVYLSGSTQWAQAQANVSGSSYGMLGVVTDAESQNEVLIEGTIQISGSALSSGIAGQPVYLSAATAGQVTLTAPTASNNVVRIIGYITKANSNIMYFRPDSTYTVII